ncbi:MAG: hypothetical protein V9H26_11800 [Verrucomicrobiota bacterium]
MKFSAVMVLLVAASQTMLAQPGSPASRPVRSVSGEFIVSDARSAAGAGAMPGAARTDQNRLALEPAFLAVTCERVKQALYADLGVTTLSRGIVNITIRSIRGTYRELAYTTERFGNNWIYRLDLPPQVERHQLLRVLVQVLLQEMANRTATDHLAEIPAWLTEGFTQQLLNSRGVEIILPPPNQSFGALMLGPTVLQARQRDPLEDARRVLHDRPPLSIAELSWLGANQMNSAAGETFRCSAQLFVSELLALPQGREHLRTMINDLANCYNWQTAFLRAFAPHFANQLAVEKWWTLQVVHFVGRDPMNLWTGPKAGRSSRTFCAPASPSGARAPKCPPMWMSLCRPSFGSGNHCARRQPSAAKSTNLNWHSCGSPRSSWCSWTTIAARSRRISSAASGQPPRLLDSGCSRPGWPRLSARRSSSSMTSIVGVPPFSQRPAPHNRGHWLRPASKSPANFE